MISHTDCEHESTPAARSRCRRARSKGEEGEKPTRKRMGGSTSTKDPDDNYGQTPRDRDKECHTCGVERIEYAGRDAFTGMEVWVGEKCKWRVARSEEFRPVP